MTTTDLDTWGIGGDQCQADAQVFFFAQQVVRVIGLKRQAEQGRDWTEGDVAFFPVQAQAENFLALPVALADHPGVRHRAGIGACQGAGQGKTRDIVATGQPRQVMITLCLGAVMQQQFCRTERVRDHDSGGEVAAAGRQLHRHLRVGIGGKALATKLLGNDQGKKAMLLDMLPGGWRQVHGLADLPVADHGTERFGRAIDKGLFFLGQLGLGIGQQFVPVRATAEQLAIPPDGAGINGVAFGLGHRRQGFLEPGEQRGAEEFAAQVGQQQWQRQGRENEPQDQL